MLAKDLSHHLSDEARSREPSPLKEAFRFLSRPGMISLGGGLPMTDLFPFDDLQFKSRKPPFPGGIDADISSLEEPLDVEVMKSLGRSPEDIPLARSLQYGQSQGDQLLIDFIKKHMSQIHAIPYEDWDIIMSIGNSFSWDGVCRTFTNRGDSILVEQFSFPSAMETAKSHALELIPVKMDLEGILPDAMANLLDTWPADKPKPKLLYTVPTGQNPVGSSLNAERRKHIYDIACKHDILIIEDEPYYYLQMPEYESKEKRESHSDHGDVDSMIKSFVPSFLKYDVDGRVIRLDSFSKILAPGLRMGWVVAQKRFVERHLRLYETTQQAPSGMSQSAVYGLLRRWGQQGYYEWLLRLRQVYTAKRDLVCDTIEATFPKGKYEFCPPVAGMFFWVKLDARQHRQFHELGEDAAKCEMAMFDQALENKVLMIPGHWFIPEGAEVPSDSDEDKYAMYFRGTFASVSPDHLVQALKTFAKTMEEELTA